MATYNTTKSPCPTPLVRPTPTAPAHIYTHIRFHSHRNVVACASTCATQTLLLLSSLAGPLCCRTQVAASLMSTCVQTMCPSTRIQTYTLLHGTHTEAPRCTKKQVQSACALVYTSASRHKHMHMHTQVSPRPCPATELFWAGPRANKVSDCQLPAGPSRCLTGLGCPAPTPGQTKSMLHQIPA